MTYRRELRAQMRLALPLAAAQLGQQAMGMVDTLMLGNYSATALAGAGLGNSIIFTVTVLGMGLVMGLDSLVPQALGAGDEARARRLVWTGARLAVRVGIPLTLVAAILPLGLPVIGADPAVASEARLYVAARLPGIVPFLVFTALRSYLQAHDLTRPIVGAIVVGNLTNLVLDGLLIYGDEALTTVGLPAVGLPAFGIAGASATTSVVCVAMMLVMLTAVRQRMREISAPASPADAPPLTGSIVRVGLPIGLQLLAEVGIFAITSVIASTLGEREAAGHQIGVALGSFTFSLAVGIGAAASVRVGRAVGAGDHHEARRAGLASLTIGLLMLIPAALFLAVPGPLADLFTDDAGVVAITIPVLQIAALFQITDGAQAVAAGALRGAGDTVSTFWANLAGHYGVGLGVALGLTFGAGIGVPGLWWGLCAGLSATAVVLIARFWHLTARPIARR